MKKNEVQLDEVNYPRSHSMSVQEAQVGLRMGHLMAFSLTLPVTLNHMLLICSFLEVKKKFSGFSNPLLVLFSSV